MNRLVRCDAAGPRDRPRRATHLAPAVLEVLAARPAAVRDRYRRSLPDSTFIQHEQPVLFYRLLLELLDGQPRRVQIVKRQVGPNQRGVDVELPGEHPHLQELVVAALEDFRESVAADALDEDRDRGMVEDLLRRSP